MEEFIENNETSDVQEVKEKRKYTRRVKLENNDDAIVLSLGDVENQSPVLAINKNGFVDANKNEKIGTLINFKYELGKEVYFCDFGLVRVSKAFEQLKNEYRYLVNKGTIEKLIYNGKNSYMIKGKERKEEMVFANEGEAKVFVNNLNDGQ